MVEGLLLSDGSRGPVDERKIDPRIPSRDIKDALQVRDGTSQRQGCGNVADLFHVDPSPVIDGEIL